MALKKNNISFASTGQFSRLFMDYVSGNPALRDLYTYSPDLSSYKQAIDDRSSKELNRELISTVLKDQYKNTSNAELQLSQIEKLRSAKTFTVCTGHQLCLFTGPLYFVYKIITTINLAAALKKTYPDMDFVPVYWMASEDHDIEEIRHVHLFGKTITWNDPTAKGPAGRLKTDSIGAVLDELDQLLGDSANAKELSKLFRDAYTKENLASATRQLVHSLFGKYGLLILDGDDVRLKAEFLGIIKDDISNNTNFKLVEESANELKKKGYDVQVNPREINVFLIEDNDRIRIEKATEANLKLSSEKYSPNVVLRPLYQQKILPNLAYVGGPGEIAYWLEYKKMFDHHKIQFPVLMPRNFALLTDEKTSATLNKLGLRQEDIFRNTDELIRELVSKNAGSNLSLDDEAKELKKVFETIITKSGSVDPTLKASVEAEMQKAFNSLKNIETKLLRAEKQKQETGVNQIKKIKEKFLPAGSLQERHENFSSYYVKTGQQFIDDLKQNFDPFEFNLMILE